jgi:hypothetical protein
MRHKIGALLLLTITAALLVGIQAASAHQCPNDYEPDDPECQETAVYDDWRPNYVPLFDLSDRDGETGEQQRYDAQRWRDECNKDGEYHQQCLWMYGGQSIIRYPETDDHHEGEEPSIFDSLFTRPNEVHVGYAATHCFLAEGAHDCDRHGAANEFDTHDSHGGALYADVCLSPNSESKYCEEGMSDTQAGVTIVDHLTCPLGCFDEYHVVRPLDTEYTQEQMDDSAVAIERAASDPQRHLCGYPDKGSRC